MQPCHQVLSSIFDGITDHYRLGQQMNNRRKKALVQIGILFMAGLGLAASGRTDVTESGVEAVAVIEVTSGFTTTYNVGLSLANNSDCTARALQLNTMLNNLRPGGRLAGWQTD